MALELTGREVELAQLARLAAEARACAGTLVLVSGEAGVGKTALARATLENAGMAAIEAAASETSAPAYAPVAAILRAGIRSGAIGLAANQTLKRCLSALLPELDVPEPSDGHDQSVMFEAVATAITEMAECEPLGILVDDVHWADAATLDTLAFLADVVPRLPVLLLVTYRSEDIPRGHPVRRLRSELRRKGRLLEIALQPLGSSDTARLLAARLKAPPSPQLAAVIHGHTEGLPFFTEEVAAALVESDSLRPGPAGLELDPQVALPLPESVRDAVLQRVDRLPPELREALAMAAVAGREFELSVLSAAPLDDALARLPSTGLVIEQSPGRFAFRHSLIRDAVYESIPWARRRTLHGELARRLEAGSAPPHTIADHCIAAGDATSSRAWLLAAARASYAACAYRDAAAQVSRALDLWPPDIDVESRLDALELLARSAELGAAAALGVRALTEAIDLLEGSGDRFRYAEAQRRLAALLELQGAWDRALTARQLAADAYAAGGHPAEAAAECLAGAIKFRSAASFRAALEVIAMGKAEAEAAGRGDLTIRLRALEGNVRARAGDADVGLSLVRAALSDALAGGDFGSAAEAYQRLADALEHAGDYRAARSTYFEAADFCRTNGAAAVGDLCLACLTFVLRQTGEWDEALRVCRDVVDSPTSNAHAQAVAHGVLGSILHHRGRNTRARSELHNSNVLARRIGLYAMEVDSETNLARLAAGAGRMDEAVERSWRVVRLWEQTDRERHCSVPNLRWIATLACDTDAVDLLKACTTALVTIASQPDPEAQAAVSHALAEGLLMEGDAAAAAARFERAATILEDLDLTLERAEVQRRAGAAHARAGDRSAAVLVYRSAYRAAIRLGARPLAARIAEEVAAMGEKVERRLGRLAASGVGRDGLSPRELEVARLVAGGLTSREVAARLTLSPRTVEMHVHRILTKLDCRTRVDITRRAAELGLLAR